PPSRLSAERGKARINELQVIGNGDTVHRNGVLEVPGLTWPREFKVRKGRDQRDGCEEHIPLPEEGTVRGAVLLALRIPGEVVTHTGQPPLAARLREPVVVSTREFDQATTLGFWTPGACDGLYQRDRERLMGAP